MFTTSNEIIFITSFDEFLWFVHEEEISASPVIAPNQKYALKRKLSFIGDAKDTKTKIEM